MARIGPVLYSALMLSLLRTLEFLGLSLWLGSDVFLSFVVAPGAFRILASRDQAGAMVGSALWWMHMIGVVCGIVILLARLVRTRTFASLATPAALCVVLMIGLTVVSQHAVSPKMAALRVQMGSIQAFQARMAGVQQIAPDFGFTRERCANRGIGRYVFDGERVSGRGALNTRISKSS